MNYVPREELFLRHLEDITQLPEGIADSSVGVHAPYFTGMKRHVRAGDLADVNHYVHRLSWRQRHKVRVNLVPALVVARMVAKDCSVVLLAECINKLRKLTAPSLMRSDENTDSLCPEFGESL